MFKTTIAFLLATLGSINFLAAQHSPWPQVTELDRTDVYFAANIMQVTFVYRQSDFKHAISEKRSKKFLDSEAAALATRPPQGMRQVVDFATGNENITDDQFRQLKKEKTGLPVAVWHATWPLRATFGGSTGVPFEYHAFVRVDGELIAPHIYFCDFIYLGDHHCFSALPFSAIEASLGKPLISADKALELTRAAIGKSKLSADMQKKLALKQILLRELPFAPKLWGKEAKIYELQFQEQDNVDRLKESKPLSIWVTIDGECSSVTLDSWSIVNK